MNKKVSIIIRTKNEEKWITSCLTGVFNQTFSDFEVIIVDNNSTDKTLEKVKQFDVKIVNIDEYLPGKALNIGIRASTGEYIVCLSGHCIPVNNEWLEKLIQDLSDNNVAGVYGRQEPLSFSSSFDKRDLLITFGLDKIVQKKDTFFHNANSALRRSIWNEIPFDDRITNIEDRLWAQEVIRRGHTIIYEPEARVYHYHGIHQGMDPSRCDRIIQILEKHDVINYNNFIDPNKLNIVCLIPVKGDVTYLGDHPLLEYTIKRASQSKYIKTIVVTSDNPQVLEVAENLGADICLERPQELSLGYIELQDIFKFSLTKLENKGIIPDLIIYLSIMHPFRPKNLIDIAIENLIRGGYDTVIPVMKEYRSSWIEENGQMKMIDEGFIPSQFKKPIHIGISGLVSVSYPFTVWEGERLGHNVGMLEIDDFIFALDVGRQSGSHLANLIIKDWWAENQ